MWGSGFETPPGDGDSTACLSVVLCVRACVCEGQREVGLDNDRIRHQGIPACCSRRAETNSWLTCLIIYGLFSGARRA